MAVPVFQVDAAIFDSDHRADVAGLRVLDDHAELDWVFGRARLAPARGKNVGSIAIHAAILESLAAQPRDDAPDDAVTATLLTSAEAISEVNGCIWSTVWQDCVAFLRAGYPTGMPSTGYVPLAASVATATSPTTRSPPSQRTHAARAFPD